MERQAGLGRSLEDVLDSVPPIEPTEPAANHVLFGIAPDDPPVTNGTVTALADSKKKKKKKNDKKTSKKKSKGKNKNKKKQKNK